jgi:uncharacterized protein DUF3667
MNCTNCNTVFNGNYCPDCGEKKFNKHDISLTHFVEETFESFVHFDSKFLRTVKTLVAKPGQLSLDYISGKRVRYMKPVQLFLVINLIFFFLIMNNIFSIALNNYINYEPFISFNTKTIVAEKLKESGFSYTVYRELFNEKINANSKEFIFLFIPVFGACFSLLFLFKHRRFTEHLVFATHFMAFLLLYFLLANYLISLPLYAVNSSSYNAVLDTSFGILSLSVMFLYLFFAVKRFYNTSIAWSVVSALLTTASFFVAIQGYRMLLFYKIVYLH